MFVLLQNLEVTKQGYKMFTMGLSGQTVRVTIQMMDGTAVEVCNIGNVIITIDGKRYQTDYASAEAINAFVNAVLETGF